MTVDELKAEIAKLAGELEAAEKAAVAAKPADPPTIEKAEKLLEQAAEIRPAKKDEIATASEDSIHELVELLRDMKKEIRELKEKKSERVPRGFFF